MPSQVQLAGESNGLSVGSLSLDGNGAQSGSLITTESVKQLRPTHYTHPSTINNGHVDSLDVFIDDINHALSGALSRNGLIYKNVSVLFLRWEDDVFINPGHNNGVQGEIDNLQRVLTEAYGFETELYLIPSKNSHRSLQRKIFHFQEVHDRRDELLGVYYGGHGEPNKMDQSVWSQGENGASVDWFSIQHLLETAVPDVLILLDCCFAASADQRSVDGTVEILAACGHETETPGISDWSFSNRLSEILRDMKDQSFTVTQLHSKLVNYRAVTGPKRLMRTPHHGIMSNKDKASIRISALKRNSAIDALDDIDLTLSEGSEHSNEVSPRVLIAVSFEGNPDTTTWRDWLLSLPPTGITGLSLVKPEGVFGSHSVLGVFSLPVALWDLLPERSAYRFVSFVTTPNLVSEITPPPNQSIGDPADIDHTSSVQSQPVKPEPVEDLSSNFLRSMDSKTQESSITTKVSNQTLPSAHSDTFLRGVNDADSLVSVFDLAEIVAKLYSAVKSRFEWYSESYRSPDFLLNYCFLIESKRLQLWAGLWLLDHEELTKRTLADENRGILSSFELILRNMLDLFRRIPQFPSGADSSGAPDDVNEIKAIAKTSQSRLDLQLPPPRLLIKRLCYFNDCLDMYSTPLKRTSLSYSLRTLCVREKASRLTMIHDAAALLGHKGIQQWTKARFLIEREWDEEHESAAVLHIQKELAYDKRGSYGGQLRSLETYNGQKVLVDWYYSPKLKVKQNRMKATTAFLSHGLGQLNLCILRFVGYVERAIDDMGCAFVLPDGTTQTELDHWLSKADSPQTYQPDLGSRFKLANTIARTILGMHTLNWFHENISPRNIVVCSGNEQAETILCYPYLLGFGLHRHYKRSKSEVIWKHHGDDDDFDYYRHPEFRKYLKMDEAGERIATHKFRPSYDIYSLGIVLYEIGIWQTLSRAKLLDSRQMLTEEAIKILRGQTGHGYTNAVIACLDGSLNEIWETDSDDDPQQLQDHLLEFQRKIIDPLAGCSA